MDQTRRDARARTIATVILPGLNDDELRVLEVIGLRILRIGRETHGPLDIRSERRNWRREGAAELADRIFYDAVEEISRTYAEAEDFDDVTAERKAFDLSDGGES